MPIYCPLVKNFAEPSAIYLSPYTPPTDSVFHNGLLINLKASLLEQNNQQHTLHQFAPVWLSDMILVSIMGKNAGCSEKIQGIWFGICGFCFPAVYHPIFVKF